MPPEIKTMTRSNSRTDGGPVDVHAQASVSAAQEGIAVEFEQPEGTADDARDDEEVEQALEVADHGRSSGDQSPATPVVGSDTDTTERVTKDFSEIVLAGEPGIDQEDVRMDEPESEAGRGPRAGDGSPSPPTPPVDASPTGDKPDPQTGKDSCVPSLIPGTFSSEIGPRTDSVPVNLSGYIFMLDSLGTTHVAAGKLLNRYLASEAKERKQIDFEPAPLVCKKLDVSRRSHVFLPPRLVLALISCCSTLRFQHSPTTAAVASM